MTAVQGVTVSADLPGIVEKISFDSGRMVRKGDMLVKLDTSQEEAQMAAAEARRNLTRLNLDRMKGLHESGVVSQSDYDRAVAEAQQNDAQVGEIRATSQACRKFQGSPRGESPGGECDRAGGHRVGSGPGVGFWRRGRAHRMVS